MAADNAQRLEELAEVDRAILAQDPHAVLHVILETARRLTNAEAAQLYRISGRHLRLTMTFPADSPLAKIPWRQTLNTDNSSCGIAMSAPEPLVIPDIRLHRNLYQYSTNSEFLSELIAPLWAGREAIGAISLTSGKAAHFTAGDVAAAQALAGQAAVAIVYADHLNLLDSLRQIDRAMLREGASLDDVGSVILRGIIQLVQAEQGQILTVDWKSRSLTIIASTLGTDVGERVPLDDSVCGDSVIANKPVRIGNWQKDERYREKFKAILPDTVSELAVPMVTAELSLALNVESPLEDAFTARHEQVLLDFARQAAIALRHVTRVRKSLQDLETITKAAVELSNAHQHEALICQSTLRYAKLLTDAPHGQVLLRRGKKLVVVATSAGAPGDEVEIRECASGLTRIMREAWALARTSPVAL